MLILVDLTTSNTKNKDAASVRGGRCSVQILGFKISNLYSVFLFYFERKSGDKTTVQTDSQ